MNKELLLRHLRNVPDFPLKGIQFKDVSTWFKNAECLAELVNALYDIYKDKGITKVVGIESRGFVVGAALALRLGAGFVMCRKPGKLPAATHKMAYGKEYGTDTIEIHDDAIAPDDVVLIHDDLLATGGSMRAAYDLVRLFEPKDIYVNFLIELRMEGLKGHDYLAHFIGEERMTALLTLTE